MGAEWVEPQALTPSLSISTRGFGCPAHRISISLQQFQAPRCLVDPKVQASSFIWCPARAPATPKPGAAARGLRRRCVG